MKRNDLHIVKYLINNKIEEHNISTISKNLKIDYKNTYSVIKKLEKDNIVKLEVFGQSSRVKLINRLVPIIFEAETLRKNDILKNKNLNVIFNDFMNSLKSKLFVFLIFGSYAKKNEHKNSDIDLMFIVPDEKESFFEKEIAKITNSLPLPIHALIFSESEFLDMIRVNLPNVGQEALKNNVILHGIEYYYEMLQNERR